MIKLNKKRKCISNENIFRDVIYFVKYNII